MNVVDFIITLGTLAYLFHFCRNNSFTYHVLGSIGFYTGFIIGVMLAPHITEYFSDSLHKGFAATAVIAGCSIVAWIVGVLLGRTLSGKLLVTNYLAADTRLASPYKLTVPLVVTILLSQTLIYIPIQGIQFVAQGSTILYAVDKTMPETWLERTARTIDAQQFENITLKNGTSTRAEQNIQDGGDFHQILEMVKPSIVKISGSNCTGVGFGSGVVVAPGFVVTNDHVIAGASSVYISDLNGAYPATPVVVDEEVDIAILYSKFINAPPISIAGSDAQPGDSVISMGYAGGGSLELIPANVTTSKAFGKSMYYREFDLSIALLLDKPLNPGDSGGPVFNTSGELVGVNAATGQGTGVAVHAKHAKDLLDSARRKFKPTRTHLCDYGTKY